MIDWFICNSKDIQNLTIAFAAVVGGLWVLYRFFMERSNETAMQISVDVCATEDNAAPLTLVKVKLSNIGKRILKAKIKTKKDLYTYVDNQDCLLYSASLQIKKIRWPAEIKPEIISWHNSQLLETLDNLSEINLLDGYVSKNGLYTDFWLEPSEAIDLLCPLILEPGQYLIKAIFIGNNRDADYWSQVIYYKK